MRHRTPKWYSPEFVKLWRRARLLRDRDQDGFRDASMDLHVALGRAPWDLDLFEALDEHRDTEITSEMIRSTAGRCVCAQWGLIKAARDLGFALEKLDRETA